MTTGLLLVLLIVIGLVLVLFPTMDGTIKKLLLALAILVFIAWLFSFFGLWGELNRSRAQVIPSSASSWSMAFLLRSM